MFRIEWTVTGLKLNEGGLVELVRYDCSGQRANEDGSWTEVYHERGQIDVPADPKAKFAPVDGMTQLGVLKAWVFPRVDATAMENRVMEHTRAIWVEHPERVAQVEGTKYKARRDPAPIEAKPAELDRFLPPSLRK